HTRDTTMAKQTTRTTKSAPQADAPAPTKAKATTKATKAKATTKAKAKAAETKAAKRAPARQRENKLSALDAAARVLGESQEPLNTKALIERMAAQGLWTSPGGATPHSTLYAAIIREIGTKGAEARFQKIDRGQFALAGSGATIKARKAKPATPAKARGQAPDKAAHAQPADGTPGPKAVSKLFKI
ncbi:MAG: winged helix-turn-helix domain-containing protein, partial [Pirellulales bacterium]|nr:winged helix-turn-helix domain-containing protein [Pirellulales bacterium]